MYSLGSSMVVLGITLLTYGMDVSSVTRPKSLFTHTTTCTGASAAKYVATCKWDTYPLRLVRWGVDPRSERAFDTFSLLVGFNKT